MAGGRVLGVRWGRVLFRGLSLGVIAAAAIALPQELMANIETELRSTLDQSLQTVSSLRALALGILRDPVVAEQVVQATFREVRYEAARFDPSHFPVFGWLAELTRVSALQRARAGVPSIFA